MADAHDVLTLAEAETALKGMRGDPTTLPGLITAVSRRLDGACGPIVIRTVGPVVVPGGACVIILRAKVVGAVTATEAWTSETPVAVPASSFAADVVGPGTILERWGRWGRRVTLTYQAGRFATTATVGEPFKAAAKLLLQHVWRRGDGGGSETYGPPIGFTGTGLPSFGFPNIVADQLTGEMLPPATE